MWVSPFEELGGAAARAVRATAAAVGPGAAHRGSLEGAPGGGGQLGRTMRASPSPEWGPGAKGGIDWVGL